MGNDTRDYLRATVATEVRLAQGWSDRLSGDSIAALRPDAPRLATVLGPSEPESERARDEAGRFVGSKAWMNQALRAARGTTISAALGEREPEFSRLGAGHGGLADWLQPGQGFDGCHPLGTMDAGFVSGSGGVSANRESFTATQTLGWLGGVVDAPEPREGVEHRSVLRAVASSEVV